MRPKLPLKTIVLRTLAKAWREPRGATAIEYGLILALVVITLVVGLVALADSTTAMWGHVETKVAEAR
ncbi:Flp family type IVb pilin [Sphingomonas sp. 4RDLI-65]|uniref:Flp family type IVb pilin n=1 Tax=Sphingomonas sp. 4RDLI-65 TaxID=3111641 RepID=UPI003C2A723F